MGISKCAELTLFKEVHITSAVISRVEGKGRRICLWTVPRER